jgi:hypothetical protein
LEINVAMLDRERYQTVLIRHNFRKTDKTEHAVEFLQESSGELVYIKLSHAFAGLAIH